MLLCLHPLKYHHAMNMIEDNEFRAIKVEFFIFLYYIRILYPLLIILLPPLLLKHCKWFIIRTWSYFLQRFPIEITRTTVLFTSFTEFWLRRQGGLTVSIVLINNFTWSIISLLERVRFCKLIQMFLQTSITRIGFQLTMYLS